MVNHMFFVNQASIAFNVIYRKKYSVYGKPHIFLLTYYFQSHRRHEVTEGGQDEQEHTGKKTCRAVCVYMDICLNSVPKKAVIQKSMRGLLYLPC